jgi:hypothetical protein
VRLDLDRDLVLATPNTVVGVGFGIAETCAAHVALHGTSLAGALGMFDDRLLVFTAGINSR